LYSLKLFMTDAQSTASAPLLHIKEGIATITLNRPAQRNRLENEDLQTLLAHFQLVNEDHTVRVVVLTANTNGQPKPVFCAGYDIGGFDEEGQGATSFERVPEALAVLRPITICALNGSVYGGATDMVLACDLRIGLQGIEWRMPATAIGLHYYPSGLARYIHRMGLAATKRAFLTARPFTWQQLDKLGLFENFLTADVWQDRLNELTQDIFALAPLAAEETKKSINEIATGVAEEATLRARVERTSLSQDFAEGRAAFAERRKPVFRGQ
jgi:enoyl-CoA hydratase/carnithine racemase